MDSREVLRALGGSLGGILRGHLTASRYVRAFSDTDGKRPLKGNIKSRYGSLPMNPCPLAHAAQVQNLPPCTCGDEPSPASIPGFHLKRLFTNINYQAPLCLGGRGLA